MSLYPAQRRRLRGQSNAVLAAVRRLTADLDRPVTEEELQVETWVSAEDVTARLTWLEGRGEVRRQDDGWVLGE